jgi:hypothetical protein
VTRTAIEIRQRAPPPAIIFPQGEDRFSLSDGSKLPPTEEEIIDLFLGRRLHMPDREADERPSVSAKQA